MEPHSAAKLVFYHAQVNCQISDSEAAKECFVLHLSKPGLTLRWVRNALCRRVRKSAPFQNREPVEIEWGLQMRKGREGKEVEEDGSFWPNLHKNFYFNRLNSLLLCDLRVCSNTWSHKVILSSRKFLLICTGVILQHKFQHVTLMLF